MIKRNNPKPTRTRRWPTIALMLVCGLTLVAGFFFAGRQHFASMDYGMKNSRLRKQVDDLVAEKRRLLLAREIALSPNEIKKAAKKIGFTEESDAPTELAKATAPSTKDAAKDKVKPLAASVTETQAKPMVVRTASVTPVPRPTTASYSKNDKSVKPVKRTVAAE